MLTANILPSAAGDDGLAAVVVEARSLKAAEALGTCRAALAAAHRAVRWGRTEEPTHDPFAPGRAWRFVGQIRVPAHLVPEAERAARGALRLCGAELPDDAPSVAAAV